jgi:hypothetical protein
VTADVVALVDDHVSVAGQQLLQSIAARQALAHRDVEQAGRLLPAAADRAERRRVEVEELPQALPPLFEQGGASQCPLLRGDSSTWLELRYV